MANNLVREQHLQALAETSQQYTLDIQSETIDLLTEAFQVASGSTALPVAGVSTLGMIKVGAGLSMVGDTLTVNLSNLSLGSASSTVEGAFWLEDDT